nr:hypothetical protein [uncultured Cohaesibacter sp.]
MARPSRLILATALLVGMSSAVLADFDSDVAKAYAPYRVALFKSNQKDVEGTKKALAQFQTVWNGTILETYPTAPARYADEAKWSESLQSISAIAAKAVDATAKGEALEAHEILEAIRNELDDLRDRNGVRVFSSFVNAYHAAMEPVLVVTVSEQSWSDETRAQLLEQAGVLGYLSDDLVAHAPAELLANSEFKKLLKGLTGSVRAFMEVLESNDPVKVAAAQKALKPAYAKLFVKFG